PTRRAPPPARGRGGRRDRRRPRVPDRLVSVHARRARRRGREAPPARRRAGALPGGRGNLAEPPTILVDRGDQRGLDQDAHGARLRPLRLHRQPPARVPRAPVLQAPAPVRRGLNLPGEPPAVSRASRDGGSSLSRAKETPDSGESRGPLSVAQGGSYDSSVRRSRSRRGSTHGGHAGPDTGRRGGLREP